MPPSAKPRPSEMKTDCFGVKSRRNEAAMHFVTTSQALVSGSKALVSTSVALVTSSFLLLLVRHLFLVVRHLFLVAKTVLFLRRKCCHFLSTPNRA